MVDKYNLISFAPSIAIVGAMLVMVVVGVCLLKKSIAKDAAAAERK
ncbi:MULTISPECIES: hypothetical protein [Aliamphritea]|nr:MULTISPECIES: hypothetical protein [Aliamphritea]